MSISPDRILFQDDHLLAVNKLVGELTVRGKGELGKLPLYDFLHREYPGLRVLHRLDFDTSGVILFARTKAACDAVLHSHFRWWNKIYRAIVAGSLARDSDMIRMELPARARAKEKRIENRDKNGVDLVPAVTHYRVLQRFPGATYVECEIETGRHHQIRRHFAAIKHPLVLDEIYGDPKFNKHFGRATGLRKFLLHAQSLDLPHPITGEKIHVEAPLPHAFTSVLKQLQQLR